MSDKQKRKTIADYFANSPTMKQTELAKKLVTGAVGNESLGLANRLKEISNNRLADFSDSEFHSGLESTMFDIPQIDIPKMKIPRSLRAIDEQFTDFDIDGLTALKKDVNGLNSHDREAVQKMEDTLNKVEDVLEKYIDDYQTFEKLNSEQFRTIKMKQAELELEHENHVLKLMAQEAEAKLQSKYDWKEKWRHLFIKSLGTALFIGLLLFVGWLVKTYEWAELPYSSVFKSIVPFPKP